MNELKQPKVRLASKFERQVDRRTFVDKKGLYDGVSVYPSSPALLFCPLLQTRNHCDWPKRQEQLMQQLQQHAEKKYLIWIM